MALQFTPYPYVPPPRDVASGQIADNLQQTLQTALNYRMQAKTKADQDAALRQQQAMLLAKLGDEGGSDAIDRFKSYGGVIPTPTPTQPARQGMIDSLLHNEWPTWNKPASTVAQPGTALAPQAAMPRTDTSATAYTPTEKENAAQQSLLQPYDVSPAPPPPSMTMATPDAAPSPIAAAPIPAAVPATPPAAQPSANPVASSLPTPKTPLDITPAHIAEIKAKKGTAGVKEYLDQEKRTRDQNLYNMTMSKDQNSIAQNTPATYDSVAAEFSPFGASGDAAFQKLKAAYPGGSIPKSAVDGTRAALAAVTGANVKGDYFGQMGDIREQQLRQSLIKDARDVLDPAFQTGPGKEQVERLNNIGRAQVLGQQMLDQKGAGDPQQMREFATTVARVIQSGGATAQSQVDELVPDTARGNAAKLTQWLTNNPAGAEQQGFINRYMESLHRERAVVQSQIQTVAESRAPTLRTMKERYPADYQAIMDSVQKNPMYTAPAAGATAPTNGPAIGEVRRGYRFTGGNPADPKSWVKQ